MTSNAQSTRNALKSDSLKPYWDDAWKDTKPKLYPGPIFDAHSILRRYLPSDSRLSLLEIGCVPGNWMVYFHREFGYDVHGVDNSTSLPLAVTTCEINGIEPKVWNADAFTFTFPQLFDVVYSGGFIEHFDNYQEVIDLHVRLTKPGGYVVLSVPNLLGVHGPMMRCLHPDQFATHRLALMDPSFLKSLLGKHCDIIHCNYCMTYRPFYALPQPLALVSRVAVKALKVMRLQDIPNRYFSPHLWVIAKKRATA